MEVQTRAGQAVFLTYNITRVLGFSTGVNISTLYYEHKNYNQQPPYYFSSVAPYPIMPPGDYYPVNERMDFSFITVPLQLKLTIPSKPNLNLSAGAYYSFLQHNKPDTRNNKVDKGYVYSAGVSYPFNDEIDGLLNVRYFTGREVFSEYSSYKHGSVDFSIGIAFKGLFGKEEKEILTADTISGLSLIYSAGLSIAWNEAGKDGYSEHYGPSAGFMLDIPIGKKTAFRTGLSFDRTGYSFSDSSDVFYGSFITGDARYKVSTRNSYDYIRIPALLKFNLGKSDRFYLSAGPYLALKLNARSTGEAWSVQTSASTYQSIKTAVYDDIDRLIKDYDTGWTFGTGIIIPGLTKNGAEIGLQYTTSFNDVFDRTAFEGNASGEKVNIDIRNRILLFHFGLKIPVQK